MHVGSTGSSSSTQELRVSSQSSGYGGNAIVNLVTGQYGYSGIYFGDAANYYSQPAEIEFVDVSNAVRYNSPQYHQWQVLGSAKMTLNVDNVGIGTTSPNQKLTIDGTDQYVATQQTSYPWGGSVTLGLRMGTDATAGVLDFRRWTGSATLHGTALITQVNSDGGYGLDFRVDNKSTNTSATTSRMFLSTSGEVGIGTISPSSKTHIFNSSVQDGLFVENSSSSFVGSAIFGNNTSTTNGNLLRLRSSGSDKMVVLGNGNAGIGITAPVSKLHVYNNDGQTSTAAGITVEQDGTGDAIVQYLLTGVKRWTTGIDNSDGDKFKISQNIDLNTDNVITLTTAGNVGIGTTGPSYLLDVNEDDNVVAFRVTGGGGGAAMASFVRDVGATGSSVHINAQNNFPQIQFVNTGNTFSIGGDTSGNFKISDNTAIGTNDRITIDNAGNVGIRTTDPLAEFHVQQASSGRTWAVHANTVAIFENNAGAYLQIITGNSNEGEIWFSDTAGQNRGRVRYEHANDKMEFWTAGAERAFIDSSGNLHADADVVAYSSSVSDIRLKDNINTIDSALNKVKKLRGVEYTWNAGSRKDKKDLGVIAQEVEEVLPEIVHEHKMDLIDEQVYKTVDYEKITAVLIEAIKELNEKVKILEDKIQTLENQ